MASSQSYALLATEFETHQMPNVETEQVALSNNDAQGVRKI